MRNTKLALLAAGIAVIASFTAACSPPNAAPSADNPRVIGETYDTQFPLSAMDYTTLYDKEVGLVLHELNARMSSALNVANGEYPAADEILNTQHSVKLVDEAIVSIANAYPPRTYEDDRIEALRLMENAKASLNAYTETLENFDAEKIKAAHGLMKGDYTALSAVFNVMWE